MNTMVLTVGLPRSGKSTIAKQYAAIEGIPIVNPDAVRMAVHGQRFWSPGEPLVWATVKIMIKALYGAGHDTVLLDATNLSAMKRLEWRWGVDSIEYIYVDTSPEVCKERAIADGMPDLCDVIDRMHAGFDPLTTVERMEDITSHVKKLLRKEKI